MTKLTKTSNGAEVPLSEDEIAAYNKQQEDQKIFMDAYKLVKYKDDRKYVCDERGCNSEALIVALWERIMENKTEESDRLQTIMEQVKLEVPKPA